MTQWSANTVAVKKIVLNGGYGDSDGFSGCSG